MSHSNQHVNVFFPTSRLISDQM